MRTTDQDRLCNSPYIAATAQELTSAGPLRRAAAVINQRVLFPHRGHAILRTDQLDLSVWDDDGTLVIAAKDVVRIDRRFTSLYGRFLGGGSAEWGAPVIITEKSERQTYLLFNHQAFLEKSSNVDWHLDLLSWWNAGRR